VVVFSGPLLSDFFPQIIVVVLRGFVGIAVRADQAAISNHFFHFYPTFLSPVMGDILSGYRINCFTIFNNPARTSRR
jgi:hypothetical protein